MSLLLQIIEKKYCSAASVPPKTQKMKFFQGKSCLPGKIVLSYMVPNFRVQEPRFQDETQTKTLHSNTETKTLNLETKTWVSRTTPLANNENQMIWTILNYFKTTRNILFIDVLASRRKPSSGLTSGAGRHRSTVCL